MVVQTCPEPGNEAMPKWALDQQQEITKLKKVVWINATALFGAMGSFVFGLLGLFPLSAMTLACGLLIGAALGIVDVIGMSLSKVWSVLLHVTVNAALYGALAALVVPNSLLTIVLSGVLGGFFGLRHNDPRET